jgi:hypothetical protein
MRLWTWSRQHAVAVRHKIHRVRFAPENAVMLKCVEPVDENLCVGPYCLVAVRSLNEMLMQESDGRFDELHIGSE